MDLKTSRIKGEFDLIHKIRKAVSTDASVMLGIGDDTAILKDLGRQDILFTTDMLIEGRHFDLKQATPYEIGWKALAVNLSDIAAMGGVPKHAVVAAGLPSKTTEKFVFELYRGMKTLAGRFGVNLVGGDTNQSEKLILSVALLGVSLPGRSLRRSGAKIGDIVAVSGPLGGSYRSKKHLRFMPRVLEAQALARHFKISAMMDISDGLSSDLRRLAEASGVGITLEEKCIPLNRGVQSVESALHDGEDFELLYTVSLKEAGKLLRAELRKESPVFYPIGWVTNKRTGVRIRRNGKYLSLKNKGYDHFK